jgi:hypothetical protein
MIICVLQMNSARRCAAMNPSPRVPEGSPRVPEGSLGNVWSRIGRAWVLSIDFSLAESFWCVTLHSILQGLVADCSARAQGMVASQVFTIQQAFPAIDMIGNRHSDIPDEVSCSVCCRRRHQDSQDITWWEWIQTLWRSWVSNFLHLSILVSWNVLDIWQYHNIWWFWIFLDE